MASSMDQDTAQTLFHQGATLVFLNVPEGTEFGIDYNSWTVGPNFRGVKMIPPGIHFVYYSAVSKEHQVAPRTGFFHNFRPKEVLIKHWDSQKEDIDTGPTSAEEQERVEASKMELDRYLGAYPYESYKKWVSLTNHITPELVDKIQPISERIVSVTPLVSEASNTQQRRAAADKPNDTSFESSEDARLPAMKVVPGSAIQFTQIPRKKYPDGASPSEITKYSMDHSYMLQTLLDKVYDKNVTVLGELQFAFICFLIGQVYDAFEQWKHLVHLLCACDEALSKNKEIFDQFIGTMYFQVREIPEDFFVDIVSCTNFLTVTLQMFFSNIETSDAPRDLKQKATRFQDHLQKKFKWDFTSEPDEYAPTIVLE